MPDTEDQSEFTGAIRANRLAGLRTRRPSDFLLAILSILMYQILALLEERALLEQYGPQ
jgi:hypothetical protein